MAIQLEGYAIRNNLVLEDYSLGLGEALSATAEETWLSSPMSSISRIFELNQANPKRYEPGMVGEYSPEKAFTTWQSKEQAESQTKQSGVELDIPDQGISQEKLDILIARKREEVKRMAINELGPQGFLPGAAKIVTALGTSMLDPLNVASAFVPIVSQARMVRLGTMFGRTGGRVATGVIEGTVGAALLEPLTYAAKTQEQAEYGLYDSYLNIALGGVLGGGLHAGMGFISDAITGAPAQVKQDLLQSATAQALENRRVDVTQASDMVGLSRELTAGPARQIEIDRIRNELAPLADEALPRGEVKRINGEIRNLEYDKAQLESQIDAVRDTSGRVLRKEGLKKTEELKRLETELQLKTDEIDSRQQVLRENQKRVDARSDMSRLEQGIVPNRFKERIRAVEDANAKPLFTESKQSPSPEADPVVAKAAQEKLDAKPDVTTEAIDKETDEIVQALNDNGVDTAELTEEIARTNAQAMREANGMKQAVMCMLGVA